MKIHKPKFVVGIVFSVESVGKRIVGLGDYEFDHWPFLNDTIEINSIQYTIVQIRTDRTLSVRKA